MTTKRWTDAMLDTLAGVVSVQSGDLATLQGIAENNSATMLMLLEEQRLDRKEFIARMDAMQSEIRGLQTENRRILERLEGLSDR
jgi:hypothetical protein